MMKQPTKEQVKELWEWCECKGNVLAYLVNSSLSLDNLFKWAVPFLIEELANSMAQKGAVDLDFCRLYIMTRWLRAWNDNPEDPALALFWAIYEVLKDR